MIKQSELLELLNSTIKSHEIRSEGNKIIAKRLIQSRNFANFTITYLKNSHGVISLAIPGGRTLRYNNTQDLLIALGSVSYSNR